VFPVPGVVEPLLAVLTSVGLAVNIFDTEANTWIDVRDCSAAFVQTKLEFAELLCTILV